MDATELLSRVEKALGSKLLEKGRFGRAGTACAWVEWKSIAAAGRILRDEPGLEFDWLENLAVTQLDDNLLLTLFLSRYGGTEQLVVRASAELGKKGARVEAPELREIWPTAAPYERENAELFGVVFGGTGRAGAESAAGPSFFPLRKGNA